MLSGPGSGLNPAWLATVTTTGAEVSHEEPTGTPIIAAKKIWIWATDVDAARVRSLGLGSRTPLAVRLVEDGMTSGDHHAHPNGDRSQAAGADG